MAEDTIERVKLELGKKAAAVNRKAALILELSRLRLEAGNLRGEIAQTEREKEALVAQAAMEAYEKWKKGEEFLEELEEAFSQARELEEETIDKTRAQQDADARRLTSFVGIDHLKEVDLNLRPWILKPGDVILLCSDGISGVLSPPELLEAMSLPPDEGCALLETMVLEKQIPEQDNYTGVMIAC